MAVGAVCTTALAGCGSGTTNNKKHTAVNVFEQTVDENGKVEGLMYEKGLPLVDEGDYSFSIFVDDSSATGQFYMMNEFLKQTNVDVEVRCFPFETATERLNLDLNSGDYADVIGGWTLTDSSILTYGVEQGVFLPLEDYFERYCPNISAILDLPGVREEMTAPDGHIYTIPYVCDDATVSYAPFINERWLENVGMEMPTTTEEFEAVLKAFKAQDANGDGDPNNEIPFSADPNNKHLEAMTGWFGVPMNKYGEAIVDGEAVYGGVSSEYRQFLSWFHSLYEQGLVDTELFTQDSATWSGKGNRDLYGCAIAYGSNEFSGIVQTAEKSEFGVLPVLNVEQGGTWLRDTNGYSVFRTQAVITDNAENPEVICRWFDNAFELENAIGCSRGPLDVVVFKEGDNYRAIDTSSLDSELQEQVAWNNLWPQSLPKYIPSGFQYVEENPIYDEHKVLEETYEPYLTKEVRPSFWVDLDSADTYADNATAITDYYTQQQAMFISGVLNVDDDATWNEYVNGIKSLGLEEWLSIRGIQTILE